MSFDEVSFEDNAIHIKKQTEVKDSYIKIANTSIICPIDDNEILKWNALCNIISKDPEQEDTNTEFKIRAIVQQDFLNVIKEIKPVVSNDELIRFKEWTDEFGG